MCSTTRENNMSTTTRTDIDETCFEDEVPRATLLALLSEASATGDDNMVDLCIAALKGDAYAMADCAHAIRSARDAAST